MAKPIRALESEFHHLQLHLTRRVSITPETVVILGITFTVFIGLSSNFAGW